ncbi:hypothetical protein DdX_17138 [Ditylenchus destructor]|uniref:Uncharacterized protein n=1 Tax=Ditylenchus destructor TaxID=166010 RepID=A0AAD4QZ96_9BILA|nr:hypothetical protein DdX_17138 [Ditylenchus destructor]
MQSNTSLKVQYFFLLLLLCTATISSAYISPFYFRTKPYMGTMATTSLQRSPEVNEIQNESPKVESTETDEFTDAPVKSAAPKDHPVRIMDLMIIISDAMRRYFGNMSSHANILSKAKEQRKLLIQSRQQILKKQLGRALQRIQMEPTTTRPPRRRAYDHNCFFTPVNCHPWI